MTTGGPARRAARRPVGALGHGSRRTRGLRWPRRAPRS